MDMLLDINVDIYPIELGDHLKIALSRSLTKGSAIPTPSTYEATVLSSANTLMNDYDYVMHGKVFKFKDSGETKAFNKAEVYISFGGLLMQLTGEIKQLEQLDLDQSIYLLMKKT
jgi:DNA-directed RNA polymerases I, II, and III subunit RPABC3